jgi:serine O-acetyltransferase
MATVLSHERPAESGMKLVPLVRADVWRASGRSSWFCFIKTWFNDPAFRPVFTMRLAQFFDRATVPGVRVLSLLARLWHRRTQFRCGADLPWDIDAGAGLKLLHGWGIVINKGARIGENVTIMQGVTVGGTGRGVPVIEDDVIICANATVIGGITIGRGAVVGAGCVVTRDVAPHTTVVGNPQRAIERKHAPKGFNPLPPVLRQSADQT